MKERWKDVKKTWWKEAVVYQIYPRSFQDGNGDGIGDIKGIASRLDYLRMLGVDVIWLSPVYQSPNDDNGYDISDYQAIMSEFGTMEDFDEMLALAHEKGLRVMMDLVVNHTSDEHRWFAESRKSRDNPYRDYYIWRNPGPKGGPPNNWGSRFGGPAWEYDASTAMYYLHLFSKKQPDLNWDNEGVRKAVFEMMDWWCKKGIDGFRMDVISLISKTPEMPDGKADGAQYGDYSPYCVNGPRVHEYLREMNREVLSRYNLMTVGETAGVTVEEALSYGGEDAGELNMVFHFDHVDVKGPYGKWTDEKMPLGELKQIMTKWQTGLGGKAWNSLYWDNHDQPRAVSRFGDDREEYRELSAKMLATCLHMMQGTPYIYQGEELGMTNCPFDSLEELRDIESIQSFCQWTGKGTVSPKQFWRFIQFMGRDNARTPMQWSDEAQAGFTTGLPWIKVNPNYRTVNAKAEIENPDSVFHYYRKLIALRKRYEIIVYGTYELLLPEDERLFMYKRMLDGRQLLVVCNFSSQKASCRIPDEFVKGGALIGNYPEKKRGEWAELSPYEAFVQFDTAH